MNNNTTKKLWDLLYASTQYNWVDDQIERTQLDVLVKAIAEEINN